MRAVRYATPSEIIHLSRETRRRPWNRQRDENNETAIEQREEGGSNPAEDRSSLPFSLSLGRFTGECVTRDPLITTDLYQLLTRNGAFIHPRRVPHAGECRTSKRHDLNQIQQKRLERDEERLLAWRNKLFNTVRIADGLDFRFGRPDTWDSIDEKVGLWSKCLRSKKFTISQWDVRYNRIICYLFVFETIERDQKYIYIFINRLTYLSINSMNIIQYYNNVNINKSHEIFY